jgi:hypothetical protein
MVGTIDLSASLTLNFKGNIGAEIFGVGLFGAGALGLSLAEKLATGEKSAEGPATIAQNICVAVSAVGGYGVGKAVGCAGGAPSSAANALSGRFRGQPFAFGTGSRSQRSIDLAEEAATASNVNLWNVVDEVRYVKGSSFFGVGLAGGRILHIGDSAFGRTRAGQLAEAAHEIIHAQRYNTVLLARGGNFVKAYEDFFEKIPFGSELYALEEVATESLAIRRVSRYLGCVSPQQQAASGRYINHWLANFYGTFRNP